MSKKRPVMFLLSDNPRSY